jgi:Ca2+-binding EF-hand superfamily protein
MDIPTFTIVPPGKDNSLFSDYDSTIVRSEDVRNYELPTHRRQLRNSTSMTTRMPMPSKIYKSASNMPRVKIPYLEPSEKQEISDLFKLFDSDGSDGIDLQELKIMMLFHKTDYRWAFGFQLEIGEMEKMISIFLGLEIKDIESVQMSLAELEAFLIDKMEQSSCMSNVELSFKLFDIENKNCIQIKDLKRVAKEINVGLKDEEAEFIMGYVARDGGGEINLDDWANLHALKRQEKQLRKFQGRC